MFLETIFSRNKGFFIDFCKVTKESVGLPYINNTYNKSFSDKDRILKMYTDARINNAVFHILNNVFIIYEQIDWTKSKKKRIECLCTKKDKNIWDIMNLINKAVSLAPDIGEFVLHSAIHVYNI